MAAVLANGTSRLTGAAREPEIVGVESQSRFEAGFRMQVSGGLEGRAWTFAAGANHPGGAILDGRLKAYVGVAASGELMFVSLLESDLDPHRTPEWLQWLREGVRFEGLTQTTWGWIDILW